MKRQPRLPRLIASLLVAALGSLSLFGSACGSDGNATAAPNAVPSASPPAGTSMPAKPVVEGSITVFAASSLTDAFKEAGVAFSQANPRAKVAFSFASSSALATQINEGAPADVFASADAATMKLAADRGTVGESSVFARNTPIVVVAKGAPVRSFEDLAKPGIKLVLAAKDVPIGNYSRQILANPSAASGGISPDFSAKVLANLKSEEANVRAVLSKVQLGEADAGIVYKTDVGAASQDVSQVEIPARYNVVATYPVAIVAASKNQALARAFVEYLLSAAGQAVLAKYGFAPPAP